ncbi:hypothetical protein NDU88_006908 [Pleurodeles waltl]|uniref:Uncharacterized protein n=1 Tax=Pleurodeles waltl TaxID=8319 RepID=A0AAV7QK65_PLEWA|nr:hypothetical protein NDU88_006908 [Pleurodeles waltl]
MVILLGKNSTMTELDLGLPVSFGGLEEPEMPPGGVPDRPHKVPDVTYKKKGTHTAASGIRYGRSLVIFPELVRILW